MKHTAALFALAVLTVPGVALAQKRPLNVSDVWMASWDGTQEIQLTFSAESASQPRWSPDNKFLSFVSSRQGAKDGQLWLLNRGGGEAVKVSEVKGGVAEYAWAPDGKRLVFVVSDAHPRDPKDDDKDR